MAHIVKYLGVPPIRKNYGSYPRLVFLTGVGLFAASPHYAALRCGLSASIPHAFANAQKAKF